jgi:serine/threonine-protein kinase
MGELSEEKVCSVCGFDNATSNPQGALPIKTMISNRYIIGAAKTVTGESITYIGYDTMAEAAVSIKEYFPSGVALRNPDKTVSIIKGNEYPFNEGLLEFIEINKKISEQSFTALIPVLDVFEENGTAFAVSQYVTGIKLRDFLSRNGGTLKWEQARALFLPLIDTIKGMNDLGIIHKGISVDTVIVGRDGKLRISDYAVNKLRTANSDFDVELVDGFAAIEQYGGEFSVVDTYTDVYGFAATLFNVLIGTTVPKARLRLENGSMSIPAKFAEELPRHVLAALANSLQVKPLDRTKDMESFKNELVYGEITEAPVKKVVNEKDVKQKEKTEKKQKNASNAKYIVISAACTALVFILIGAILIFTIFRDDVFGTASTPTNNTSSDDAPVVDSIGTVDSDATETAKLYSVPDLCGKTYSEILENEEEYEKFQISIVDKEFSDKYPVGVICAQSVKPKSQVEKDTAIQVTISLGPKEIEIASVKNLDEQAAKLELLKQGFLYNNIEVMEKYDEDATPGVVLDQEPKAKSKVSTDIKVKIYINSYEGEEETDSDNSDSNGWF